MTSKFRICPFSCLRKYYQLYQWHNGSSAEQYIEFLPQYRFLSLDDAITQYQLTVEIWRDVSETENWEDEWVRPEVWFPVFAEDGNFYVVEGQSQPKTTAPIIHFSEYVDNDLIFNSLTDMMLAIAECLKTGAYFFQQSEYGDTYFYLDADDTREAQIWLKYQPQRTANVEAILNHHEHLSPEARLQAYCDLVTIQHPQALAFLVEAIKNAEMIDSSLRAQIIHWRGAIDNPQVVQFLLNLLQDGDWDNHKRAIQNLVGTIQEKELIKELWEPQVVNTGMQLQLGTFESTREDFATLLEMLGTPRAVTPLIRVLQNYSRSDWEGRLAAIEALGNLGYRSAIDPLFQVVQYDKDPAVRLAIAKALLTLGDARARKILVQLAQANIPIISEQAQAELSSIDDASTVPSLVLLLKKQTGDILHSSHKLKSSAIQTKTVFTG